MSANIAALFQDRSSPTLPELQKFHQELTKSSGNIFFNRERFNSKKQLYVAAMQNLVNTGRMFNMHGDHVWNLGLTESGNSKLSRPQAVQVPPNQIWVLLTRKYTVTYAGAQQDTANWCAFKHLCWPITGAVGGESVDNCYGADPVFLGQSKDLDLMKMYETDNKEGADPVITIADRIKARKNAKAKKEEEQKNKADLKAQIGAGGVDEDEWEDFVDTPFRARGRNKKINNDGKELYWNIQMFYGGDPGKYGLTDADRKTKGYDGDWCYVQRHLFEQAQKQGTNGVVTDPTFNNFKLGKPVRDERECFLSNGGELPMGAYLHHLDGKPHKNVASELNMRKLEGQEKDNALDEWNALVEKLKRKLGSKFSKTEMYKRTRLRDWGDDFYLYTGDFQTPKEMVMVDEKFNNSHTQTQAQTYKSGWENVGIHRSINDTEKLMNYYYEQDRGAPSINILCSCSPGYETPNKPQVDRNSVELANNEVLRDRIEYLGRKGNYCKLRGAFIDAASGGEARHPGIASLVQSCNSPIYPQYEDHKGITLAGTDDREAFYINLGKTFQAIQAGVPEELGSAQLYTFSPLIFLAYYNGARNTAFAGSNSVSLVNFNKQYSRWYNGELITRGIHKDQNWISGPSIKRHLLLPYEQEVKLINKVDSGLLTQGGARQLRFKWWGLNFIPATEQTESQLVPIPGERWWNVFGEGRGESSSGESKSSIDAIPPPLPSTIFRGGSKTKKRRKRKRKRKRRKKTKKYRRRRKKRTRRHKKK